MFRLWFPIFILAFIHCTLAPSFPVNGRVQDGSRSGIPPDLLNHPKIIHSDGFRRTPSAKEQKIGIIVNVRPLAPDSRPSDLRSNQALEALRRSVRHSLDSVIGRLKVDRVQVKRRFEYIPAFAARASLQGLEDLLAMEEVLSIEVDGILEIHTRQGISLVNATQPRMHFGGRGVAIAICDTGIDYTHPKLGGGGFPNGKVIGGYDFGGSGGASEDDDPMDENGHGTSCAGIAAGDLGSSGDYIGGIAPEAKLYALKVTQGSSGEAYHSDLIAAWEWCITHRNDLPEAPIAVISTSLGSGGFASICDSYSPAMTQAAAQVTAAGIALFASAGNSGYCDKIAFPACISHIIAVGAVFDASLGSMGFCVDPESCAANQGSHAACSPKPIAWSYNINANRETPYSNTANFLDLFAPSHNASTTAKGGGYTSNFGGTSASCPYAAGAAAVLQSASKELRGGLRLPSEVRSILIATADPVTDVKVNYQKGRINLGSAIDALASPVPAAHPVILMLALPSLAIFLLFLRMKT